MKKFFEKIMILLAVLPSVFMASCFGGSNDKTARLELKNALVISQNYIVGEDVKLNDQMFDYYKSIDDSSATESDVWLQETCLLALARQRLEITHLQLNIKMQQAKGLHIMFMMNQH